MRRTLLPFGVIVVVALGFWTLAGRAADKNRDWAAYGGDKGGMNHVFSIRRSFWNTLEEWNGAFFASSPLGWPAPSCRSCSA